MSIQIDDIIVFGNKEYLVLDVLHRNSNTYLYLINNNEFINDTAIIKVENNEFKHIKNDEEFNLVLSNIILDFKDSLIKIENLE